MRRRVEPRDSSFRLQTSSFYLSMVEPTQTSAGRVQPSGAAPLLEIRSVNKSFGGRVVLREISLAVTQGEFLTILGESGSGKTTLLRLIAGFEPPDAGEIWMGGERLDPLPPFRRRVNTVFQHYALFPHLSVFENVAYGLRAQKAPRLEIPRRVEDALAMVKMTEFARLAPGRLSGGQQQRVALARALVNRPKLLLLDEPLSALDANLRRQMRLELKALQREVGISFVFVTHDQEEAMALSDRIALLHAGELEQVASPDAATCPGGAEALTGMRRSPFGPSASGSRGQRKSRTAKLCDSGPRFKPRPSAAPPIHFNCAARTAACYWRPSPAARVR